MQDILIKPLNAEYDAFIWELLYNNIFIARENELADRELKDLPELKNYIIDWGLKTSDVGFIALDAENQPVGAAWSRLFTRDDQMWGYLDNQTPELSIAIVERLRGRGLGTKLLQAMFKALSKNYDAVSLSVHPSNRAVNLYKKHGFTVAKQTDKTLVMVKRLN